jgi:hypothetical protein
MRKVILPPLGVLIILIQNGAAFAININSYAYYNDNGQIQNIGQQIKNYSSTNEVFLNTLTVSVDGTVSTPVHLDYPSQWRNSTLPLPYPKFTALINSIPLPANTDFPVDPSHAVKESMSGWSSATTFDGNITVDAEFENTQYQQTTTVIPTNLQHLLTSIRELANKDTRGFSFYLNPKYLDPNRYIKNANLNAQTVANLLGSETSNYVIFPTYTDDGSLMDANSFQRAITTAENKNLRYRFDLNIQDDPATFATAMGYLKKPSAQGWQGFTAYSFNDNTSPIPTTNMIANLKTLEHFTVTDPPTVPEPATLLMALLGLPFLPVWRQRKSRR